VPVWEVMWATLLENVLASDNIYLNIREQSHSLCRECTQSRHSVSTC
jgi:hypothetical protein